MTNIANLLCPLPVVHQGYDDNDQEVTYLKVCGEPLVVVSTGTGSITIENEGPVGFDDDVVQWRVECHRGHVLLIPDIEDRSMRWDDCGNEWLPAMISIRWEDG